MPEGLLLTTLGDAVQGLLMERGQCVRPLMLVEPHCTVYFSIHC